MTTTTVLPDVQARAETILERAVCLSLRCHWLGNDRKLDLEELVEAAHGDTPLDETQYRATMKLIDQSELKPARREIGLTKKFLTSQAIPTPGVFGERSYLIPMARVAVVEAGLREYRVAVRAESQALAARYAAAIARQAAALGPRFKASLYKTPADVAAAFDIEWDYVSFDAPERLERVDQALFEESRAKYEGKMADAYEEVRIVLRASLRELTKDIVDRLRLGPDGKPKAFRGTILNGLAQYLETFSFRNITDDAALQAVVAKLQRVTAGLDVQDLRDSAQARLAVTSEMAQATALLDGLISTGRRAVTFGPVRAAV